MAAMIQDMVAVRPDDSEKGAYRGVHKLVKMGNNAPIAFGGCVLSQCVSAAFASLPKQPDYELYSVLGNFLGPGSIEVYTKYEVEDIRTTKTFATRKVVAWQNLAELPEGSQAKKPKAGTDSLRRIMILLLDFQVKEKYEMFDYSPLPVHATPSTPSSTSSFLETTDAFYSHPSKLLNQDQYLDKNFPPKVTKAHRTIFPLFSKYFLGYPVANSMGPQLALGLAKDRATNQDNEPLQRRTNAMWCKVKEESCLDQKGANEATTAFLMDSALAFLPLTFTHQFLDAMAACSTLELSLRFMCPPDMTQWHLHEQTTEAGMRGRTYSTGRLFNEEGRLVAVMTQMGIMRGWPEGSKEREKHSKL